MKGRGFTETFPSIYVLSIIHRYSFGHWVLIMPQTSKKLTGHIGFGLPVHASIRSRTVHARVLKFHIWIPHGKIFDTPFFFLVRVSSFLELCPFEKI